MILASSSPRRREILSRIGYDFRVVAPDLDETPLDNETPAEHVVRLSREKALRISQQHPEELVIGADTIVVLDNKILGKPVSPDEAIQMLTLLSGRAHTVFTGLSLMVRGENIERVGYDATRVVFNNLDPDEIRRYVETGESLDKAGAYGIQGMGSFLVNHYEGEFDTVIGFPTKLFARLLGEVATCRKH